MSLLAHLGLLLARLQIYIGLAGEFVVVELRWGELVIVIMANSTDVGVHCRIGDF